MKTCPICEEEVKRRVKGNCPHCNTKIELIKGSYIQANFIPPVKELARILEKQIKLAQDNIFPYRIPQHMILRTNSILENMWMVVYPVIEDRGIKSDIAIWLFEQAVEELISRIPKDRLELGLVLWYVSGKDNTDFQRILTRYVRSRETAKAFSAKPDEWMD